MQDHDTDGFIGGKTDVAIFFLLGTYKAQNSGSHILVKEEEEMLALLVTHL